MDIRQMTLRQSIRPDVQLHQHDWFKIIYGIADRLVYAHSLAQVHGDLKPSNGKRRILDKSLSTVLVDLDQNRQFQHTGIYVTDFGIRYLSRTGTVDGHITSGTFSYLAPELRNGTGTASWASDMWAVGCIGYELCLGSQLSHGFNRGPIDNLVRGGYLDLSAIDQRFGGELRYIIGQCLQHDPNSRCTAVQLREYIRTLFRNWGIPVFG